MRTRTAALALALFLPLAAGACGFCIEDRVAAVYDQATVEKAMKEKRHVAFFGLEGESASLTARTVTAAFEAGGAQRGATRVSLADHACAVVYDPRQTSLERVAASAGRALGTRGVTLTALRVIDEGGKLKDPAAP